MPKWLTQTAAYALAGIFKLIARTCTVHYDNDPRPALKNTCTPYVLALWHAEQLPALIAWDEPRGAAMVSASRDGDLLVCALRCCNIQAVRGSNCTPARDKGGRRAVHILAQGLSVGLPALVTVDGPKGPAHIAKRGALDIAKQAGAQVLPVRARVNKAWVLSKTWDQMLVPKPFARIHIQFMEPLSPQHFSTSRAAAKELTCRLTDNSGG